MQELNYGKDAPEVVNVVIEIRRGEGQNKYGKAHSPVGQRRPPRIVTWGPFFVHSD